MPSSDTILCGVTPVLGPGDTAHDTPVAVYVTGTAAVGGAVTIADGADVAQGATTDAAVSTDTTGTISGKLRGLVKLLASVISLGRLLVDGSGVTQPVSAASLPLPSGAATGTKQDTGNTSLASIDGKITAVNTGAVVVSSSALPSGAATSAKQPAMGTAGTASADVITIQGIASMTKLLVTPDANSAVNVAQINGVTPLMGAGNTGTGSPRVTIASDQAQIPVVGPTASGSSLTAAPLTTGRLAKTALPTAVADGQVVNDMGDKYGRAVTINQAPRDLIGTQTTTIAASTAETTIVTAAASIFADLVLLTVSNTSATDTRVDFRDDTAGSVIFSLFVKAGAVVGFAPPVPVPQTAVNKNWTATCITSLTDLRIFAQWVKNR